MYIVSFSTLLSVLHKTIATVSCFVMLYGVQVCLSLHKSFFFSSHTGERENLNSMMTKYAPERIAFEYVLFPV